MTKDKLGGDEGRYQRVSEIFGKYEWRIRSSLPKLMGMEDGQELLVKEGVELRSEVVARAREKLAYEILAQESPIGILERVGWGKKRQEREGLIRFLKGSMDVKLNAIEAKVIAKRGLNNSLMGTEHESEEWRDCRRYIVDEVGAEVFTEMTIGGKKFYVSDLCDGIKQVVAVSPDYGCVVIRMSDRWLMGTDDPVALYPGNPGGVRRPDLLPAYVGYSGNQQKYFQNVMEKRETAMNNGGLQFHWVNLGDYGEIAEVKSLLKGSQKRMLERMYDEARVKA